MLGPHVTPDLTSCLTAALSSCLQVWPVSEWSSARRFSQLLLAQRVSFACNGWPFAGPLGPSWLHLWRGGGGADENRQEYPGVITSLSLLLETTLSQTLTS